MIAVLGRDGIVSLDGGDNLRKMDRNGSDDNVNITEGDAVQGLDQGLDPSLVEVLRRDAGSQAEVMIQK